MHNYINIHSNKLKLTTKRTILFALALILSLTSLTTLITPKANATSLPNVVADPGFNSIGTGFDAVVRDVKIQADGKILVGGNFLNYNGTPQSRLIRLNPDGSKDDTFDIGSGFGGTVHNINYINDELTLVSGSFDSYQDQTHNRLIRLMLNPDRDQDGLDDTIEDSSPNSGDSNNDGTQDSLQNNVTSYINPLTNSYHTIQVDNQCSLTNVSTNPSTNNSTQDTNYNYPLGLYDFTANCGTPGYTTNFKVYYYGVDTTKNYTLRKYNPNTNTYATIDTATFNVETIAGQPVLTATYNITDGSSLDTDGLANGIIVDPAGPALTNPTTATLPTAPNTGSYNKQNLILTTLGLLTLITLTTYTIYKTRNKTYRAK